SRAAGRGRSRWRWPSGWRRRWRTRSASWTRPAPGSTRCGRGCGSGYEKQRCRRSSTAPPPVTGTRCRRRSTSPSPAAAATGWWATTGGPLDLTAEQPTEQAALDEIRRRVAEKLTAGRIVTLPAGVPAGLGMTSERFLEAWDRLAANPLLDEFDKAVAEA